jgi:6-phosphogluconolactonase (cycloisomerase 2 family)
MRWTKPARRMATVLLSLGASCGFALAQTGKLAEPKNEAGAARAPADGGKLKLVESTPRDDLDGVVTAVISPDGKFLYTAAWKASTVTVHARDAMTGKLTHKQTILDQESLGGTTAFHLSPDGRWGAAAALQSRTVALFSRDATTGELTQSDLAREGEKEVRLGFPTVAAFSPDAKFVYVLDDTGGDSGQGAVTTLRINAGKLELVATDTGKDGCYAGARGVAMHPSGKTIFVACHRAGTLVVADRDQETGKTSVRQVIKDEEGDVHALAGAMGVVVSREGRFVYVSSGRFEGEDAVSVFQSGADGRLILVQEFLNDKEDLRGFEGGNHLALSRDGLSLYAAATRSGTVACFARSPLSGRLACLATIADVGEGVEGGSLGATSVTVSPDNRFVYVPTEDKKSISVFERDAGQAR